MKICDCYKLQEVTFKVCGEPHSVIEHRCNGTKERDLCSCFGDRTRCDFYPEVRKKATEERIVEMHRDQTKKAHHITREQYWKLNKVLDEIGLSCTTFFVDGTEDKFVQLSNDTFIITDYFRESEESEN